MSENQQTFKLLLIPLAFLIIGIGLVVFIKQNKKVVTDNSVQNEVLLEIPFELEKTSLIVTNRSIGTIDTKDWDIYKIDNNNKYFPSAKLAKSIAEKLSLTQISENKWEKDDQIVTFIETESYIRINLSSGKYKSEKLEKKNLEKTSELFLNEIGAWPFSVSNFIVETNVFEEHGLNQVAATVGYREQIRGSEVYTDLAGNVEILVQFNPDGEIIQVRFFYIPFEETDLNFEFNNSSDIINSIQDGEYKTLFSSSSEIRSIEIENVEKAYYSSTDTNFVQPVYLVTGKDSSEEELKILVPAFKKRSYK